PSTSSPRHRAIAACSATPTADEPPNPAFFGKLLDTSAVTLPSSARRNAARASATSLVALGAPTSSSCSRTDAYSVMAALQTHPPCSVDHGGTSVQPPPKSIRAGARA